MKLVRYGADGAEKPVEGEEKEEDHSELRR